MKKLMGKSPDRPDALALTFWEGDKKEKEGKKISSEKKIVINPITGEKVRRNLSHNQWIE